MSYGPNTSRTSRLPHGFFEQLYARLEDSGSILNAIASSEDPPELDELLEVIRFFDSQLRRQRQSHLGWESI